jgi:hypothetical protein
MFHETWVWWYRPVIPALRRLRQEDGEIEASLSQNRKEERKGWGGGRKGGKKKGRKERKEKNHVLESFLFIDK